MPKESIGKKLLYIAAFIFSAAVTFVLTAPIAQWVKSIDSINNVFIQALCAVPLFVVLFLVEERLIWRVDRQTVFTSVLPISLGSFIGYLVHFAVKM